LTVELLHRTQQEKMKRGTKEKKMCVVCLPTVAVHPCSSRTNIHCKEMAQEGTTKEIHRQRGSALLSSARHT